MFIDPVESASATGDVAEMYASEEERWGFLPGFVQTFSHHPEAYRAWQGLVQTLYSGMDRRRCELATLAAARTLGSTCCAVAHGKMMRDRFFPSDQVAAIARDHRSAGLDPVDVAIMDFAEKAAREPARMTQADVDSLKEHGLTDREVFDVAFAVAARCFFATLIESLGTTAETPLVNELDAGLLDALTVGRPAV